MDFSQLRSTTSLLALLITVVSVAQGFSFQEMEISPSTVYLGDDVTLTCKVVVQAGAAIEGVSVIEWFKRVDATGDPVEIAQNNIVSGPTTFQATKRYSAAIAIEPAGAEDNSEIERAVVAKLTITGVTAQDSGIIGCKLPQKASSGHITIDKPLSVIANVTAVTLKVIDADDVEQIAATKDQNITFTEGEKRKLYCEVTGGYPEPDVKMFLDGKDITNMFVKKVELKQEGAKEGLKALSYDVSLKNESFTFNYEYSRNKVECRASIPDSTRPTVTKKSMTIALSGYTPKFDCAKKMDVKLNKANFVMECKVIAEPPAQDFKVQWQNGPHHNQNASLDAASQQGDYKTEMKAGKDDTETIMILKIDRVFIQHFTKYYFEASNSIGKTTHTVQLHNADDSGAASSHTGFMLVLLLASILIFLS